jgi:chromate transporter
VPTRLADIAGLFLKLGTIAFGGPAAHVAMMEDEVVRRRGWLTREQFLDYLGATNLIPGPNSTELAIHIGHARAGWPGLIVAGVSFIVPAALIVALAAWAYVRYGSLPDAAGVLYGVKPVVMAVVAQALWSLGRSAIRTRTLAALGAAAVIAVALGLHELLVLAAAGMVAVLLQLPRSRRPAAMLAVPFVAAGSDRAGRAVAAAGAATTTATTATATTAATLTAAATATAPVAHWPLFLAFAKIGAVLFGSGYVLLAFLRADFVERFGWLTERQLLDAIAVGQVTPGPVFTTATFIGYLLGGPAGAVVATAGIFLPAFLFVAISGPLVPRMRQSPILGALLDGVNVASLALMAVVSWHLGAAALVDPLTVALLAGTLAALVRWRVNSAWLIAAGAAIGWLAR